MQRKTTEYSSGRYYGILSEVARKEGISVAGVRQALYLHKNPRIVESVNNLKAERDRTADQAAQEVKIASESYQPQTANTG